MAQRRIKRSQKYSSVIGRNMNLVGDIGFSDGLYVDGSIQGDIVADDDHNAILTLAEHGAVEGDVRAPRILLNGEVKGNVYASEYAELLPEARVSGNLYYRSLHLALGAQVNGQLVHVEDFDQPDMRRGPDLDRDPDIASDPEPPPA